MKGFWRHDCYILDGSVVGVTQKDAFDRGWWAYGCEEDWQDVDLGMHPTLESARCAVLDWVEEQA